MLYILLFSLLPLVIICISDKSSKLISCVIVPLIASFVCASRSVFISPSDDLIRYYDSFLRLSNGYFNNYNGVEPLFYLISCIIHFIFGEIEPKTLLFIYALITNVILAYAIYRLVGKESSAFVIFCVLFSTPYLFTSGQLIRQVMSIAIFLLYLTSNKKLRLTLFVMSIFTHYASIILFFLYYLVTKFKVRNSYYAIAATLSIPIGVMFSDKVSGIFFGFISFLDFGVFSKTVYFYIHGEGSEKLGGKVGFTKILYALFIILYVYICSYKGLLNKSPLNNLLNIMLILIVVTFSFSYIDVFSRRFFVYYSLVSPLFLCYGLYRLGFKNAYYKLLICFLFLVLFLMSVTSSPNYFSLFNGEFSLA
ncbi:MAG: EpsG family protein [Pseudoalteromonas sp.]